MVCFILESVVVRSEMDLFYDAKTMFSSTLWVDFTMLYVVWLAFHCWFSRAGCYYCLAFHRWLLIYYLFELMVINNDKVRNSIAALVQSMPREVTFHDDHSVKRKTTRQYLTRICMYMQSNLKQSQNQAEKLKKLSDVKSKVNFRSSQAEAFINRKVSTVINL